MIKVRGEDLRALKILGEAKDRTLGVSHKTRGENLAAAPDHTESPLVVLEEKIHHEEQRWTPQRVQEGDLLQKNKGTGK